MSRSFIALCVTLIAFFGLTDLASASGQGRIFKPFKAPAPTFTRAVAFDVSPPLRSLPRAIAVSPFLRSVRDIRPEEGPIVKARPYFRDLVVQTRRPRPTIVSPSLTFEGLNDLQNPFLLAPPDPNGVVGPSNYVEMINVILAVYDKLGNMLAGPTQIGTLWNGFSIPDCTDLSGDPVVLYDKDDDRWLLSQFTTRGPTFYNCVAVSTTGDPTGTYFRYAFSSGTFFPDYPKYGTWSNSFLLTSRDFGSTYGISVYALDKDAMVSGEPDARSVHFFLDSAVVPISQIGDGLLPADVDGDGPRGGAAAPIVGTMDDDGPYKAPFDALNIYDLSIRWGKTPTASLTLNTQMPVAPFNSTFPCAPTSRQCIPQPGTTRKIDILSYRQRPTFRLAYRNFGQYESMVTNQSVQALPGVAGVRWYEIRRVNGIYSLYQQGTYAPADGVHRWMGSIASDTLGDLALGFSVSNGTNVFPGIRYTGRLVGDPLGQMTLGEGTIIDGTGSQTGTSRWGDYTDMTVDPVDDCTFWYVDEYYQTTSVASWQTRIGNFRYPNCTGPDIRRHLRTH